MSTVAWQVEMILVAPPTGLSRGLDDARFANGHHFTKRLNSGMSGRKDGSKQTVNDASYQIEHVMPACEVDQIPFDVL